MLHLTKCGFILSGFVQIINLLHHLLKEKFLGLLFLEYFVFILYPHFLSAATSLVQEVIKYASGLDTCKAVYLHVIVHNDAAILFYKKMSFRCLRKLRDFYYIKGQHYDSYLFVYYVNGGRSPCSPL